MLGEIRRRVAQGHREIVLTGVNLGCFRDREAGYTLPRLVREAGAVPGVERLRLSSIEVNHLSADLVDGTRGDAERVAPTCTSRCSRATTASLRAMRRRYTAAQYLAKLAPLSDFNLTTDVIVGFPGEDDAAFERTLDVVDGGGDHQGARLPVLAAPRNRHRRRPTRPVEVKKERSARLRDALRGALPAALDGEAGHHGSRPRRPSGTRVRRRLLSVARRRARSASSFAPARSGSHRRESMPSLPDSSCLFCRLVAEGQHVHA